MGPLPVELTLDKHIKGWRKQKAKTGAVECQTNFSDHIAATFNKELAEIDQLIRQTPYEKGFGPEYAQVIEDFQILKKSGVIDVEGMRIIMMILAMYNMNNKRLGREGLANAEKYGMIPDKQAGSRKRRRAGYSALEKVLINDLIRSRRYSTLIVCKDARSCYDQIVLWIAALAMGRCGLPEAAVTLMVIALQAAKHFIKTAYGRSKRFYGNNQYPPTQGCG